MQIFALRRSTAVVTLSVLALALSTAAGVAAPLHEYRRQVLFSLEYGPNPAQIGIRPGRAQTDMGEDIPPLSLGGITVAADDLIYISDQVQRRIKRFSSRGELTLVVDNTVVRLREALGQPDIEVPLTAPGPVIADPQGRFYAAGQVFDANGLMQLSSRDKTGKILEARGSDRLRLQVAAAVAQGALMYEGPEPRFGVRACDHCGNVYVSLSRAPNEYNMSIARFDAHLQFVQAVPGTSVGWDGRSYGGIPRSESDPNDRLRIWAPGGALERTVTLRPPSGTGAEHYDWSRHRWLYNGLCTLYDASGCIYRVHATPLSTKECLELRPNFVIRRGITVYKFDQYGTSLLRMDLRGLPFDIAQPIAVDPAGNIYHLEYYEGHVDVVKETLVSP